MISSFDVFDESVRQSLLSRIKSIGGYTPSQLEPVINAAIQATKKQLAGPSGVQNLRVLRQAFESSAAVYVDAVLSQSKLWQECRESIKAYSSVLLTGAGLSYESDMPLSNILKDLLKFCKADDWVELRKDQGKCLNFKQQFKLLCDRKLPSSSHKLVMLNFPKYIYEVICLNWDDLLEKAAGLVGKSVNKVNEDQLVTGERYLWKFHGDVENIKTDNIKGQGGWVFPDEKGHVFDNFRKYIERPAFKGLFFTFVIIGYREEEKVIYDQMVALLERDPPRPTYRIGLDLDKLRKENYIVGTAEFTLSKILPIVSIQKS